MEGRHAAGAQRRLDEEAPVGAEGRGVRQRRTVDPVAAQPVVRERSLHAEEVPVGMGARGRDEEARLPAPDLDLERSDPAEAPLGLERPRGPELFVR